MQEGATSIKRIFVHGLGQTPASWEPALHLMDTCEGCVCPDLTEMVSPGDAAYPRLFDTFARFCDEMEEPLELCGLSLGGILALNYAAERPERVKSLILIAAQYRMPKHLLRIQNAFFRFMPQSMFQETGFTKAQLIQLCGSMKDLNLSGKLACISCPVLLLCGSRDRSNRQACMDLARLLKAEFHIVQGAGHQLNRDSPEKLASLLQEFHTRALL